MTETEERPDFETDDMENIVYPYSVLVDEGCGFDRLSVPYPF